MEKAKKKMQKNGCPGFPQVSEGTIKLKVGVIFGSGEVRPLSRADFYVLTKDLDMIFAEAAMAHNLPLGEPFDDYIDKQTNASPQLRAWLKKNKVKAFPSVDRSSPTGYEMTLRAVSFDDLFEIPEFHAWLQNPKESSATYRLSSLRELPKYPKITGGKAKQEEQMSKYRQTLSKQMTAKSQHPSWLSTMLVYLSSGLYNLDYHLAMLVRQNKIAAAGRPYAPKYAVKVVKTSLSGEAEVVLPAGTYWLSNITSSPIGKSSILWNIKIVVEPGKTTQIELSNDNAVQIR